MATTSVAFEQTALASANCTYYESTELDQPSWCSQLALSDARLSQAYRGLGVSMNDQTLIAMQAFRARMADAEARIWGSNLSEEERGLSVALVVGLVVMLVLGQLRRNFVQGRMEFSSLKDLDVATSKYIPDAAMFAWRAGAAAFIFVTYFLGFSSASLLTRRMRVSTFTCWSWFMQGNFFALAAIATLLHAVGSKGAASHSGLDGDLLVQDWTDNLSWMINCLLIVPVVLKNVVWVMFEIFTSVSMLVCVVVWTVLIPAFEASGNAPALKLMYSWFGLTAHNANVAIMAVELLLNRLEFRDSHMPFVLCYGLVYLAFAMYYWRVTGILYYFFLDYTVAFAPVAYLALLVVMICFFKLATYAAYGLKNVGRVKGKEKDV